MIDKSKEVKELLAEIKQLKQLIAMLVQDNREMLLEQKAIRREVERKSHQLTE